MLWINNFLASYGLDYTAKDIACVVHDPESIGRVAQFTYVGDDSHVCEYGAESAENSLYSMADYYGYELREYLTDARLDSTMHCSIGMINYPELCRTIGLVRMPVNYDYTEFDAVLTTALALT